MFEHFTVITLVLRCSERAESDTGGVGREAARAGERAQSRATRAGRVPGARGRVHGVSGPVQRAEELSRDLSVGALSEGVITSSIF